MQRKVISVNKNNIAVCNDGSVWKLKYVDITGCDSKKSDYLTEWVKLDDVPQPEGDGSKTPKPVGPENTLIRGHEEWKR